jgi:hypothetical protein
MKKSELEHMVLSLGLKCSVENNIHTIMQVWQPFQKNGFIINSKIYDAHTLGKDEVNSLNNKFEKLVVILKKNNIKIRNSYTIENGVISSIILDIKENILSSKEIKNDFEIETNFKSAESTDYDSIIPKNVGYGFDDNKQSPISQFNEKLKPHELKLIINNIDEISSTVKNPINWVIDFSIAQENIDLLKILTENKSTKIEDVIHSFFHIMSDKSQNKIYSDILYHLSDFKIDNLALFDDDNNHNVSQTFKLFEIGVSYQKIYINILKNWDFSFETGQEILQYLLDTENNAAFARFIDYKDAKKYYFNSWRLKSSVITLTCLQDHKFLQLLIDQDWLRLVDDENVQLLSLIKKTIFETNLQSQAILLKILLVHFPDYQPTILLQLLKLFSGNKIHEGKIATNLIRIFIENTTISNMMDYAIDEASIMKYLNDGDQLKQSLLKNKEFIQYLLTNKKVEYLPEKIKKIIFF